MSFGKTEGIKNQNIVLYPFAFEPESSEQNALAGLLACSASDGLPVPIMDSGKDCQKRLKSLQLLV